MMFPQFSKCLPADSLFKAMPALLCSMLFWGGASTPIARADPLFSMLGVQALRMGHQGRSVQAQREKRIVLQTSEVTCGAAAAASLLRYVYGDNTDEAEMARLAGTYEAKTSTLLGLRNACRAKGYGARGFRMTLPQLMQQVESSGVPVLVHFQQPTLHYALVLGQVDDFVLLSDPSEGNISLHVSDFVRRWSGNVLVVSSATRSPDKTLVEARRRSATTRLQTLHKASDLMALPRF